VLTKNYQVEPMQSIEKIIENKSENTIMKIKIGTMKYPELNMIVLVEVRLHRLTGLCIKTLFDTNNMN
jgi:hypothetical protein